MAPDQAEALAREISASIEAIRGLKFKTPVKVQVIDGATARERFKSNIEEPAVEEARHTQKAFVHLGLVPPGTDLITNYLDLAEKGVDGYYESGSDTFYLLDHVSLDDVRGVMAHELTHALEDQHYDLRAFRKQAANDDESTAMTAVVEGSATAVMLAFLSREKDVAAVKRELEKSESKRVERLKIAPSFTQRSLALPYLLGFSFLLRGKPWEWAFGHGVLISDLEQAYKEPPRSTRQILHPEQYWSNPQRKGTRRLTLPDLSSSLGSGWSKATEGSIGELGLAVLAGSRSGLEMPWALLPTRWTNAESVGVVGDVYQHYVNGERTATVLLTRWESLHDAEEFEHALVKKGRFFVRYGVNLLVIVGDLGDRLEAFAGAALQGASYWAAE